MSNAMLSDWPRVVLGDYCEKIGSGATPKGGSSVYLEKGDVCLIRSQNIYNEGFKPDGLVYLDQQSAAKLKNVTVEEGDVLINITGDSVARVCSADPKYLPARVNQHVAIIRPLKTAFDPRFIRYYLAMPQVQYFLLSLASTGGTRNALTKGMLESLEVPKPELDIQTRIADILSGLDEKIAINQQINATLEAMAQALFKSWFVDFEPVKAKIAAKAAGADAEGMTLAAMEALSGQNAEALAKMAQTEPERYAELKATAELFPDALVDSELGEIPAGWEVVRFKKIVKKYIDNRGRTPPTISSGIPLLEVKHLPENSLLPDLNTNKYVSEEVYENWFRAHLEKDDIVISTVGTIGRNCLVPKNTKFAIAQNLLGFRFNKKLVSPYFMYYQFNSNRFIFDVNARLVVTVQASIKRKDLETVDLLCPSKKVQDLFHNKVSPLIEKMQTNESIHLANIRDTLLPKLLSGEVSVADV